VPELKSAAGTDQGRGRGRAGQAGQGWADLGRALALLGGAGQQCDPPVQFQAGRLATDRILQCRLLCNLPSPGLPCPASLPACLLCLLCLLCSALQGGRCCAHSDAGAGHMRGWTVL
jgi:hypothetical protein